MVRSEQMCSLLPPVHGCKSLFFRKVKEPDVEPSGVLLLAGPPGCPSGLQWLQLSSRLLYEHHVCHQPFQDYYMACTMSLKEGWLPDFMTNPVSQQWPSHGAGHSPQDCVVSLFLCNY